MNKIYKHSYYDHIIKIYLKYENMTMGILILNKVILILIKIIKKKSSYLTFGVFIWPGNLMDVKSKHCWLFVFKFQVPSMIGTQITHLKKKTKMHINQINM